MTPRLSVRAAARDIYVKMAREAAAASVAKSTPTAHLSPCPSPHSSPDGERPLAFGGGEKNENEGGQQLDLMTRLRRLYEDSAVPVREIARLAGVTERTLYKYIAKGGWRRRYVRAARGNGAGGAQRGLRWLRASGHEPVKGAGGRFIARADADKPVARGIKAVDPQARARAEAACRAASLRHATAKAEADAAHVWEARLRAINAASAAMAAYGRWREGRARRAAKFFFEGGPSNAERVDDARTEALYVRHIEAVVAAVRKLQV